MCVCGGGGERGRGYVLSGKRNIVNIWLQVTIEHFALFHHSGFDYMYFTMIFHI